MRFPRPPDMGAKLHIQPKNAESFEIRIGNTATIGRTRENTMSERIPSADLAQLLGKWFREASNVVQRAQGTIDKFIGDALLAYWAGTAECDAVFGIARQLIQLAGERAWPDGGPFKIAIAL